jgi:hypothetical protein
MSGLRVSVERSLARLAHGPRRWPVVRRGDRSPIPWVLRLSIYRRDDFRCKTCGWRDATGRTLELDHLKPWSAGGTDSPRNLRVLCAPCNRRRSNWRDTAHLTRRLPTTWWCYGCWTNGSVEHRPVWRDGSDLNGAPVLGPDGDPRVLSFCAWCEAIDLTTLAALQHFAVLADVDWDPSREPSEGATE